MGYELIVTIELPTSTIRSLSRVFMMEYMVGSSCPPLSFNLEAYGFEFDSLVWN